METKPIDTSSAQVLDCVILVELHTTPDGNVLVILYALH